MSLTTTRKGRKATATVTVPSLTEQWRAAQADAATAERRHRVAHILWRTVPNAANASTLAHAAEQLGDAQDAERRVRAAFTTMVTERMASAIERGADPLRVQGLPR